MWFFNSIFSEFPYRFCGIMCCVHKARRPVPHISAAFRKQSGYRRMFQKVLIAIIVFAACIVLASDRFFFFFHFKWALLNFSIVLEANCLFTLAYFHFWANVSVSCSCQERGAYKVNPARVLCREIPSHFMSQSSHLWPIKKKWLMHENCPLKSSHLVTFRWKVREMNPSLLSETSILDIAMISIEIKCQCGKKLNPKSFQKAVHQIWNHKK